MIFLLDMDGPLAAFDSYNFDRIKQAGHALDIESLEHQRHRFLDNHLLHRHQRKEVRTWVDTEGWFRDLPVTEGAQEGVEALLACDLELWVCSKPLDTNPTCATEKKAWLAEHFPALKDRLILAPDKSLIVGDVLLDDAPKLKWLPRAQWAPVIFTCPFNGPGSEWEGLPHWSWGQSIDHIISYISYHQSLSQGVRP